MVGQRFSFGPWQEVAGDVDVSAVVGELERSRLIRLEEDGYAFAHDTLRSLVVWGLPTERRRQLNAIALQAIKRLSPGDVVGLLFHAEQTGDRAEIANWALRAGEQALTGLSFHAAARHFGRASRSCRRTTRSPGTGRCSAGSARSTCSPTAMPSGPT